MNEFSLIARIARTFHNPSDPAIIRSIGDDAATIGNLPKGEELHVSTDTLVENVHFSLDYFSPRAVGRKSLVQNLSDIAAMGARPAWYLLSLALPTDIDNRTINGLLSGIRDMHERYLLSLIGGNITSAKELSIAITIFGRSLKGKSLSRDKARPGDTVYVTGPLGDSALGRQLLAENSRAKNVLTRTHLNPQPSIDEGLALVEAGVRCGTDISDGLIGDLGHILKASGVGAEIDLDAIPLSKAYRRYYKLGVKPLDLDCALCGGEDFELLFTASSTVVKRIETMVDIFPIGAITRRDGLRLIRDGKEAHESKAQKGFEHIF